MTGPHGIAHDLPTGFPEPVADAQRTFRYVLHALAHPGTAVVCGAATPTVPGTMPATAALLLALTDHETPVWGASPAAAAWLRFHTGAPAAADPGDAAFAVLRAGSDMPRLAAFEAGGDLSPERSATLLIELPGLSEGPPMRWYGPGIQTPRTMRLAGLPDGFWRDWRENHARFPSGVDVLFICADRVVGLPRTIAAGEPGAV
jgi:alpha-D-ribose 1-methylphosphonate 5-triphosphate synthase subunit PhnH